MSKLSEGLKALINAAHARPNTIPAPSNIKFIYARIAESAQSKSVGTPAWLTISTAATMTLNSPNSLLQLHAVASQASPPSPSASTNSPSPSTLTPTSTSRPMTPIQAAELMREVGLKCISFNGIPRTINMLAAFHAGLPPTVSSQLSKTPTRQLTNTNAAQTVARGRALWDSIYRPFEDKLVDRLALSHPNLPVHIVSAHYGALLSDPEPNLPGVKVGRVLASLTAIACLRAQTGVAPQVLSHVFGLRKAFEDGSAQAEGEAEVEGAEWLAGEEGNVWVLERVDEIVAAIGASFAPGVGTAGEGFIKPKL